MQESLQQPGIASSRPGGPEVTLHRRCLALLLVAEDVGHLMDPAIPYTYVGPYICSVYQTSLKQGLQATQVLGQAPLFASCSRLTALALRRRGV